MFNNGKYSYLYFVFPSSLQADDRLKGVQHT